MEKKTVLCLITVVAIIAVVIFAGCIDEKEVEEPAPTLTPSPTLTPEPEPEPTVTPTPMLTETPTPAINITAPKPKPEEGDGKAPEEMTGTFVLHVTDQPSAIGDFDILNVSVSEVMLHRTAEAGNNGTTNETGEWITLEPSNRTFDLTKLQDGNRTTI
jgi:outer membrane biosynthesis protein TonB